MGHHHHAIPGQLAVELQEVGSLCHGAMGAKVSAGGPGRRGAWGRIHGRMRRLCAAHLQGGPVP